VTEEVPLKGKIIDHAKMVTILICYRQESQESRWLERRCFVNHTVLPHNEDEYEGSPIVRGQEHDGGHKTKIAALETELARNL
jgi:hypothetical protein